MTYDAGVSPPGIYEFLRDSGAQTPWEARREVLEFAAAMEVKLRKNDHKTSWRDKPIEALKRLMLLEVEEFKVAHEFFDSSEAMAELVDIANYALILRDRLAVEKNKTQD